MKFLSDIWNWLTGSDKREEKCAQKPGSRKEVYLPEKGKNGQPKRKGRPELRQNGDNGRRTESTAKRGGSPAARNQENVANNGGRQKRKGDVKSARHGQATQNQPTIQAKARETRRVTNTDMTGWNPPAFEKTNENDVFFQELNLDARILRALLEVLGFQKCSPIQGKSLPEALKGSDLAGRAQTGTGKTAAFLITVLQHFLNEKAEERDPWQPMAIILAPTRELAIQIAKDAEGISAYCPDFKIEAVFGGMDFDRQMSQLAKGVDLVVATPGRLLDFIGRGAVDLKKIEVVVIDEADRMLDMGFIPDVKRIMGRLPAADKRQTLLFSATLTHDIMELASRWMRANPVVIEIEPEHVVAEGVDESIYAVTTAEKMSVLLWILTHEECSRVLIFRNRRSDVEILHGALERCGISCEMLTGDVEQKKRLRILDDFRDGKIRIIVATDVAGRGIHVDDITHVINYDFPYEAEDYVHRVGRTARAGHKGRAISFADEDSAFVIPDIEKYIERPLPITQPSEEMLTCGKAYKGVISTRSSCSRGSAHSYHHSNYHRRSPR